MINVKAHARKLAEQHVHARYESARAEIVKQCMAERRALIRAHEEELERFATLGEHMQDRRKEALIEHDRVWRRERERLANSTSRAPAFGLLGPPQRNLQKEYRDRRERWEAQRESIKEEHDEKRRLLNYQRQDCCKEHAIALTHNTHKQHRDSAELKRQQEKTFDWEVNRELRKMGRDRQRLGRTFAREANEQGRER